MEKTRLVVGGDIQKALQGEYHFDLKQVLQEGWELTRHNKWAIVQAVLFIFSLAFILVILASQLLQWQGYDVMEPQIQGFMNLALSVVLAPLMTGVIMMGVNHAVGGLSRPAHLFFFVSKGAMLAISALMISLLVELGLALFLLPGIFLMIACGFTFPLIVEKGYSPMRAILISIKVVSHKWWLFVLLYALFAVLFVLVILSFGIGAIWVAPLYYNVKGILYRDIFGVEVKLGGNEEKMDESGFDA